MRRYVMLVLLALTLVGTVFAAIAGVWASKISWLAEACLIVTIPLEMRLIAWYWFKTDKVDEYYPSPLELRLLIHDIFTKDESPLSEAEVQRMAEGLGRSAAVARELLRAKNLIERLGADLGCRSPDDGCPTWYDGCNCNIELDNEVHVYLGRRPRRVK